MARCHRRERVSRRTTLEIFPGVALLTGWPLAHSTLQPRAASSPSSTRTPARSGPPTTPRSPRRLPRRVSMRYGAHHWAVVNCRLVHVLCRVLNLVTPRQTARRYRLMGDQVTSAIPFPPTSASGCRPRRRWSARLRCTDDHRYSSGPTSRALQRFPTALRAGAPPRSRSSISTPVARRSCARAALPKSSSRRPRCRRSARPDRWLTPTSSAVDRCRCFSDVREEVR